MTDLYEPSGEEELTQRRRDLLRTLLFLALGSAMIAPVLYAQLRWLVPGRDQAHALEQPSALLPGGFEARLLVFSQVLAERGWMSADQRAQITAPLIDALEKRVPQTTSPGLLRRIGVVTMWVDPSDQHYEILQRAALLEQAARPAAEVREPALWACLFRRDETQPPLSAEQWRDFEPVLEQLKLDWYAAIVRLQAYQLLGSKDEVSKLREQLQGESARFWTPVLALVLLLMAATGIGFVAGIVVLALLQSGKLRAAGTPDHLPQRPLWETLMVCMFMPIVFGYLLRFAHWHPAGSWTYLATALASHAVTAGGLFWLAVARPRVRLADVGWRSQGILGDVFWGVLGYLITLPLLIVGLLVVLFLQQLLPAAPPPAHPVEQIIQGPLSPAIVIGLLTLASVTAPLIEETLFRGLLQGALRPRWGAAGAIAGSALIFALVHPQGILALPTLFVLGASFAALRELRNSVLPGMIAHGINNAVAITLMLLLTAA